ncbi:DUF5040 domain-containing protein [Dysgonomonas sp. 520]|uniref:DUF5040 domain-containing protein n=1 Tax=Dysgonomonas sp. 520 TaxID=2302931 RepID=UPI0013D3005E|nr:DUF5040 domain-containing protein [Dysgonomonas sp. 520]NDW08712.1 DUF5040 domain-containing protein [Dysgonomonas sp. 520]
MKKITLLLLSGILSVFVLYAENKSFMLTGASFAIPQNGWFEVMCKSFNAIPLNKAVGGDSICSTANSMAASRLYTLDELDRTDAFIIFHAHNENVNDGSVLKDDYTKYELPTKNYSIAYDYVIRKYMDDCKNLEHNPSSKYYNIAGGKPARIVLCTDWHDGRLVFNRSVRELATKWNLPLIEWDKNIGFSNAETSNGTHPSVQYAMDTKTIGGIEYGWHPRRGEAEYIQLKMAEIAVSELETIFGKVPVSVIAENKSKVVTKGEDVYASFFFKGKSPWNFTYEVNGTSFSVNNVDVTSNPLIVKIPTATLSGDITIKPTHVSNSETSEGIAGNEIIIHQSDNNMLPVMDTYIHERSTTTSYLSSNSLQVKTYTDRYSRESFLSFNITDLDESSEKIIFRTYFYKIDYTKKDLEFQDVHNIELCGNTNNYTDITWSTRPDDFETITSERIYPKDLNSYINWDITNWVKQKKAVGATHITLCIKATKGIDLLNFYSSEYSKFKPQILTVADKSNSINEEVMQERIKIYPNPVKDVLFIDANDLSCKLNIFSSTGQKVYGATNCQSSVNVSALPSGVYVVQVITGKQIYNRTIIKK